MKKSLFVLSLLFTFLLADNSLGTPIGSTATIQQKNHFKKPLNQPIQKQSVINTPIQTQSNTLTTRITPKKVKSSFRKDSHRYDKRYSSFDYEDNGYYNDDGYYYGYYDNRGYFYDNVFYSYDNQYTYYNRQHHLGYFGYSYHHHRPYVYHSFNNWNRVHCYREPNVIVYGHYYERSYYPPQPRNNYYPAYNNHYGNYYSPQARMTTRNHNYNSSQNYNNRYNSHQNYNSYGSQNRSQMPLRHSSPNRNYSQHKSTSRMQISR